MTIFRIELNSMNEEKGVRKFYNFDADIDTIDDLHEELVRDGLIIGDILYTEFTDKKNEMVIKRRGRTILYKDVIYRAYETSHSFIESDDL